MHSNDIMFIINSKIGHWQQRIDGKGAYPMCLAELAEYLWLMDQLKVLVDHQFEAAVYTKAPLYSMAEEQYKSLGGDRENYEESEDAEEANV